MRPNSVEVFENELFGSLTAITDGNGGIWFIGKQVCEKLGYNITNRQTFNQALVRHCPDRRSVETSIETVDVLPKGVRRNSATISEADLYRLVMNSTLPDAVVFQDWVVREVLPSIREHDGYTANQVAMQEQRNDVDVFNQVNAIHAETSARMDALAEAVASIQSTMQELVRTTQSMIESNHQDPAEDEIPSGFMTAPTAFARLRVDLGSAMLNRSAFYRLLETTSWPTVRFNRYTSEGLLVPVVYLRPNHEVRGDTHTLDTLIRKVRREEIYVGESTRSHHLLGTYRI